MRSILITWISYFHFFQCVFWSYQVYSTNEQMIKNYLTGNTMIKSQDYNQRLTNYMLTRYAFIYKDFFFQIASSNVQLDLQLIFQMNRSSYRRNVKLTHEICKLLYPCTTSQSKRPSKLFILVICWIGSIKFWLYHIKAMVWSVFFFLIIMLKL